MKKYSTMKRVLFALLLAGVLGVGSFYTPMTTETAFACQYPGAGC